MVYVIEFDYEAGYEVRLPTDGEDVSHQMTVDWTADQFQDYQTDLARLRQAEEVMGKKWIGEFERIRGDHAFLERNRG